MTNHIVYLRRVDTSKGTAVPHRDLPVRGLNTDGLHKFLVRAYDPVCGRAHPSSDPYTSTVRRLLT